jgi:hypothetical protein
MAVLEMEVGFLFAMVSETGAGIEEVGKRRRVRGGACGGNRGPQPSPNLSR